MDNPDMTKRSELPWAFEKKSYGEYIVDPRGGCVAGMVSITGSVGDEINKANAAFLTRAVNAHDDLVAALKAMVEWHCDLANSGDAGFWDPEEDAQVKAARAALAKAATPD